MKSSRAEAAEAPPKARRGPRKDYLFGLEGVRRALNLTQAQVAERLGMTQSAVSQLEHEGDPQLSSLARYAEAIGGVIEVRVQIGDRSYRVK